MCAVQSKAKRLHCTLLWSYCAYCSIAFDYEVTLSPPSTEVTVAVKSVCSHIVGDSRSQSPQDIFSCISFNLADGSQPHSFTADSQTSFALQIQHAEAQAAMEGAPAHNNVRLQISWWLLACCQKSWSGYWICWGAWWTAGISMENVQSALHVSIVQVGRGQF